MNPLIVAIHRFRAVLEVRFKDGILRGSVVEAERQSLKLPESSRDVLVSIYLLPSHHGSQRGNFWTEEGGGQVGHPLWKEMVIALNIVALHALRTKVSWRHPTYGGGIRTRCAIEILRVILRIGPDGFSNDFEWTTDECPVYCPNT